MIKLTGLNGTLLYLNYFQIMCIETIPETKVIMSDGHYYLVRDTVEAIQEQIILFLHECITFEGRDLTAKG